jgi:diguanylate cyclase (GGDEF)-like protein
VAAGTPHWDLPLVPKRIPRLTVRFILLTALGLTTAAAVMFVLLRHVYTVRAEKNAIAGSRLSTRSVLAHELTARDLQVPLPAGRRKHLDRLFTRAVLLEGTVRATLYDSKGLVVYSTDQASIGRRPLGAAVLAQVSAGKTVARVHDRGGRLGRVLETYVPLRVSGPPARGTVELDRRYSPIAASARRSSLLVAGVLEILFVFLLAALAPMLSRAERRLRRHVDELDYVATHDQLMGLPNRLGLERAFERAAADDQAPSLLLVDLDAFHEVNETLGSESGDSLLARWSDRLRREAIGCDLVARLGDDEIGILCHTADREQVAALQRRIRQALAEPVQIDGTRIALDASIGAALFPEHGTDLNTLLRHAGTALSAAKGNEGRFAFYDPADEERHASHLVRTAELRDAIANGEFVVYYQPQADLGTRVIRGAEALLRWQHPRHGLLAADSFISAAQRSGIITQLDRFVLEAAARQWKSWSDIGIEIDVAVNLAPDDLLDPELPYDIARLLTGYEMPARHLVLEITEHALLRDERRTRQVLESLHDLGVRLAIDDYGTGYASLAYIHRLPIEQVKIDRSFIEELPESASDEAIVRSTAELAHTLGATVVAEGVERPEHWECVARLGCDIAQGYLIARPLAADALTELLINSPCVPAYPATTAPARDSTSVIHAVR